jgi:predicted ABC-type ATPase
MSSAPPTIYLIAGCNGAGKTTFAKEFLLKEVNCANFLNADYLALGLSPLSPELAMMKAGRLLLTEFRELVKRKETFALESTLSGKTYLRLLQKAKQNGFALHIHFLWLPSPVTAIGRVRERVRKGGHNVPAADIRRRFRRGLIHFIRDYAPLADWWTLWNNYENPTKLLADRGTCQLSELGGMLKP